MLSFISCGFNYPSKSDNWFASKIFDYNNPDQEQSVSRVFLINEKIGFLLGTNKVSGIDKNEIIKKQVALIFRSEDGGKSFEKQELGRGILTYISHSSDEKSLYLICGRFTETDTRKPSNFEILHSSDTGKTWESRYTFKNKYLTKVLFFNDLAGFASVMQDTIGYDIPVLYKTEDGGKSWNPTRIDMNNKTLNLITPEGMIMGQYLDDPPAIWQMDIQSLEVRKLRLNIPEDLRLSGAIQTDPVTGLHYCRLLTRKLQGSDPGKKIEDYLLCVETQEMILMPYYSFEFNVYGNFIGVRCALEKNQYIAQYKYSENKGRTWHSETPKDYMLSGLPGMYGKGYIWSMCSSEVDGIVCPLLVRISPRD